MAMLPMKIGKNAPKAVLHYARGGNFQWAFVFLVAWINQEHPDVLPFSIADFTADSGR